MPNFLHPRLVYLPIDAIALGSPLPFALRSSNGALLANRGHVIETHEQLEKLGGHGFAVDMSESTAKQRQNDPFFNHTSDIIESWQAPQWKSITAATLQDTYPDFISLQMRAHALLSTPDPKTFLIRIEELQQDLQHVLNTFPDATLAAFVYLAARETKYYSAMHALLVWVVVTLTANVSLEWSHATVQSLGKAALTMNISMTDMQDRMALQNWPLTMEQSTLVEMHPKLSRDVLVTLGVTDSLWLDAVAEHRNNVPGLLSHKSIAQQLGRLIQRADIFGARLAPRLHRQPMPIAAAIQGSYLDEHRLPDDAGIAIVKTLGVHAPGSYVRLVNAEIGIVIRRQFGRPDAVGAYPVVLLVLNGQGFPIANAIERDTGTAQYRIDGTVNAKDMSRIVVPLEKLFKSANRRC